MGNDQSRSSAGEQDASTAKPLDYYDLLQVDEEATFDEIKRSYRRLALANHPDKQPPHRAEEATRIFTELQQAYEVLSDPNERAFYDNHRNAPAPPTDDDLYEHVRTPAGARDSQSKLNKRRKGDPGVSLEQLMRFFDPSLAKSLDDNSGGFFTVYRNLFALLASDEALHSESPVAYPSFGSSADAYAPPAGSTRAEIDAGTWAKEFYVVWADFSTSKKFEWVAKWDTQRGSDRQMRRLMERDNNKIRDDYKRDYNEAVRQLALFLQHRDPRYKRHQVHLRTVRAEKKRENRAPVEAADQNGCAPGDPKETEAARQRAAAEYEEQEWQRLHLQDSSDESDAEADQDQGDGTAVRIETDQGTEIFECVACNKTFMSEASWDNHERSKKHKQAVWRLKKEMEIEDTAFTDPGATVSTDPYHSEADETTRAADMDDIADTLAELDLEQASRSGKSRKKRRGQAPARQMTEPEGPASETEVIQQTDSSFIIPDEQRPEEPSKREKRKAKEAKRKAAEEAEKQALKELKKGKARPAADTTSQQNDKLRKSDDFVFAKKKGKGRVPSNPDADSYSDEKVGKAVEAVYAYRQKLVEKWADNWINMLAAVHRVYVPSHPSREATIPVPGLQVLCLGLGKPYSDRSAQIQLALLLELSERLQATTSIAAFDPASDAGDLQVQTRLGLTNASENKVGRYALDPTKPYLLFMPHCSKFLYESILHANFSPRLAQQPACILLGNDLAEYTGFVRPDPGGRLCTDPQTPETEREFATPKKKRKGRDVKRQIVDGVLERLVPDMSTLTLGELPETNLPGFARAFLSLAFQWLPEDAVGRVEWERPLPEIVAPDDGEVVGQ